MKPYWTARRFAATVRGSLVAAELSVTCAKKPIISTSISNGQTVNVASLSERMPARHGKSSSPMSIKMMALNCGIAASDLSPLMA